MINKGFRSSSDQISLNHAYKRMRHHEWICETCKYALPCKTLEGMKERMKAEIKRSKEGPPK